MRLLLDTHIFLWFVGNSRRLSTATASMIRDPGNDVYLSVASVWEVVIKHHLGKLPLPSPPEIYLPTQRRQHRIRSLDINEETVGFLPALPPLHGDPFDRILICQARQHRLSIVTVDALVMGYAVPTISG